MCELMYAWEAIADRPNPNAKEVYQCWDYLTYSRVYG